MSKFISALKDASGQSRTKCEDIVKICPSYYKQLYATGNLNIGCITSYLHFKNLIEKNISHQKFMDQPNHYLGNT